MMRAIWLSGLGLLAAFGPAAAAPAGAGTDDAAVGRAPTVLVQRYDDDDDDRRARRRYRERDEYGYGDRERYRYRYYRDREQDRRGSYGRRYRDDDDD